MDIKNTLEVVAFVGDIFKVASLVLEDGTVRPIEVALEGRVLITPAAAAIRDFQQIPKEILDLSGEEYDQLKDGVEKVKTQLDKFLAVARKKQPK